jgi:23S rRNA (guanosine2251-2'-O)-methyltransferase
MPLTTHSMRNSHLHAKETTHYIYGYHAVAESLVHRPDVVSELYLEAEAYPELRQVARVPVTLLNPARLPGGISREAVHQGVVAAIDTEKLLVPYKTFSATLTGEVPTAVVVLGELHDPHNVGAIIRSAAAFGLAGVLIPPHRQASVTGTVIKVSAGMAFRIPLVEISNVNATLRDLKDRGFWVYGLASGGAATLGEERFDRPSAFVIGNEGSGLREKTREACDAVLSIPMDPRCESLNASNAAAVTFFEWQRQQRR